MRRPRKLGAGLKPLPENIALPVSPAGWKNRTLLIQQHRPTLDLLLTWCYQLVGPKKGQYEIREMDIDEHENLSIKKVVKCDNLTQALDRWGALKNLRAGASWQEFEVGNIRPIASLGVWLVRRDNIVQDPSEDMEGPERQSDDFQFSGLNAVCLCGHPRNECSMLDCEHKNQPEVMDMDYEAGSVDWGNQYPEDE